MSNPKRTQEKPTKPVAVDDNGRALDEFGLPLGGPARIAALAKAGKPDPREDPGARAKPEKPAKGEKPADPTPPTPPADPAGPAS